MKPEKLDATRIPKSLNVILLSLLCFLNSSVAATLSISQGAASFSYNDSSSSNDLFVYDGSGDVLYQEAWYIITTSGTTLLENGTLVTGTDSATITYTGSLGGGVSSVAITYTITDTGSAGVLSSSAVVSTLGGAEAKLVNYFDYDVGTNGGSSTFGDDEAIYNASSGTILVTDPGSDLAVSRQGIFNDSWQIGTFGSLNAQIAGGTGLNGTGSPYGPADFTGALQWDIDLEPLGTATYANTATLGEVPEIGQVLPSGMLLFAAIVRRRR